MVHGVQSSNETFYFTLWIPLWVGVRAENTSNQCQRYLVVEYFFCSEFVGRCNINLHFRLASFEILQDSRSE